MLSMIKKSHVICHVLTLQIFNTLKKLRFLQNHDEVLNWLNSASWIEVYKNYVQELYGLPKVI